MAVPDGHLNPLDRKLHKILDSKIETDKEIMEALKTLSQFYVDNTLKSRRNLRRDIESRSLQISKSFLDHFGDVRKKMDALSENVESMSNCCDTMYVRLQATKEQTHDLLNRTTKLQMESKRVDSRLDIAKAFIETFQLKRAEVDALTTDEEINNDFFPALTRVRAIHKDCKLLLRSAPQTAGLEIMDQMSQYQEKAYERLYRWIQRECRHLSNDNVEMNSLLFQAFCAMQERPVLFKYSLDEYAAARRTNGSRSFIDALTRGGPGGVPKPIELLSHDPLRYVGDMLAWIHQMLATENEHLVSLLKMCEGSEEMSNNLTQVLTHITEGVCRPFKVRVEQVLSNENGPVTLYKLSNLFRFYINTMQKSLDAQSGLVMTFTDLRELTTNMFYSSLNTAVARLLEKIESPDQDLLPVSGVHQMLLLLRDVLESHDTTLVPVEDKRENFQKMFSCVIDPLLQSLLLSVTHLDAVQVAVYMLNCLHSVHSLLSLYEYADQRLEMLQAQMDAQCDVLVSEQAGYIFRRIGLQQIYNVIIQHQPKQGPLSKNSEAGPTLVKSALEKFDLFLASPESYRLPQLSLVSATKIKISVNQRTHQVIVTAYEQIYDKIYDVTNRYDNPENILSKTVQQIRDCLTL